MEGPSGSSRCTSIGHSCPLHELRLPALLYPYGSGAIGHPLDPVRWAEERQYLRNDTREALAAFQRRRTEVLMVWRSEEDP